MTLFSLPKKTNVLFNCLVAGSSHVCNADSGAYLCKDGVTCLAISLACDGINHCPDHDDEGGQCNATCSSNYCSHHCHETPNGPLCSCPNGYELQNKTRCYGIPKFC